MMVRAGVPRSAAELGAELIIPEWELVRTQRAAPARQFNIRFIKTGFTTAHKMLPRRSARAATTAVKVLARSFRSIIPRPTAVLVYTDIRKSDPTEQFMYRTKGARSTLRSSATDRLTWLSLKTLASRGRFVLFRTAQADSLIKAIHQSQWIRPAESISLTRI